MARLPELPKFPKGKRKKKKNIKETIKNKSAARQKRKRKTGGFAGSLGGGRPRPPSRKPKVLPKAPRRFQRGGNPGVAPERGFKSGQPMY